MRPARPARTSSSRCSPTTGPTAVSSARRRRSTAARTTWRSPTSASPPAASFAGAEGIKTEEQEARYGGTAGEPFDVCYHQACDTLSNLNLQAIDQFSDNAANAVGRLVMRENDLTDNTERRALRKLTRQSDYRGEQLAR